MPELDDPAQTAAIAGARGVDGELVAQSSGGHHRKRRKDGKSDRKRKKEKSGGGGGSGGKKKSIYDTIPLITAGKPNAEPAVIPKTNLAGRPDALFKFNKGAGIRKYEVKFVGPYHQTDLNKETYITFEVRASKNEWIRLNRDSISFLVYGLYDNPTPAIERIPVGQEGHRPEHVPNRWALRARSGQPTMWLDPSIMGTAFVSSVSVSINNYHVPTNSCVGNLLQQYVRCNRVFNGRPGEAFKTSRDIDFTQGRDGASATMIKATKAFDYHSFDATNGSRIYAYLDGIFPFDFKNKTLESVDRMNEPNIYFPPDCCINIRVNLQTHKIASLFHANVNMANYFTDTNLDVAAGNLQLAFQDALLKYDSIELKAEEHVDTMKKFEQAGYGAEYEYDIVRGQHQALTAGQSYTENTFQLMPWARLVYVMFLMDHSVFTMEARRKPLSGLSRFPANCTNIRLSFAGEDHLVTKSFVNFGMRGEQHHISMHSYYEYLRNRKMYVWPFDTLFPPDPAEVAFNQVFVLDLQSYYSGKTEPFTIRCEFSGENTSPTNQQVVCLSVHTNGCLYGKHGGAPFTYSWQFSTPA